MKGRQAESFHRTVIQNAEVDCPTCNSIKLQDLPLIRKFVRRMKGSKRKIVNGQILKKAWNIGPYLPENVTDFHVVIVYDIGEMVSRVTVGL